MYFVLAIFGDTSEMPLIAEFRCILYVFACLRGDMLRGQAGRIAGNYLKYIGIG